MNNRIINLIGQLSTDTKINLALAIIALSIGIAEYVEIKRLHVENEEPYTEVEKATIMLINCNRSTTRSKLPINL